MSGFGYFDMVINYLGPVKNQNRKRYQFCYKGLESRLDVDVDLSDDHIRYAIKHAAERLRRQADERPSE